jgi:hypothetical protein
VDSQRFVLGKCPTRARECGKQTEPNDHTRSVVGH